MSVVASENDIVILGGSRKALDPSRWWRQWNANAYDSRSATSIDTDLFQRLQYEKTVEATFQIKELLHQLRSLMPKIDVYVDNDGSEVLLFKLYGTIPIIHRNREYNFPVAFWFPLNFPQCPPICLVTPVKNMNIKKKHKHVDSQGIIHHPYLHGWKENDNHRLVEFVTIICDLFGLDPPIFSKRVTPTHGSTGDIDNNTSIVYAQHGKHLDNINDNDDSDKSDYDYKDNNTQCSVITYKTQTKEYILHSNGENYQSVDIEPKEHCVFGTSDKSLNQFISFDDNHIALYDHKTRKFKKLQFNFKSHEALENIAPSKFPLSYAQCLPLSQSS